MAPSSPATPHENYRRVARWILILLGAVAALVVAAILAVYLIIDANFLEEKLSNALATSTNGRYQADIGRLDINLLGRSLRVEDVAITPDSSKSMPASMGNLPPRLYTVRIPSLHLDGISYWTLLWRGGLELQTLEVEEPHVVIQSGHASDSTNTARRSTPSQNRSNRSLHVRIAQALPYLEAGRLTIDDGMVALEDSASSSNPAARLEGISLTFHQLVVDSVSARDTTRLLFSENVQLVIDRYQQYLSDSLYLLQLGPIRGSSQSGRLVIDSMSYKPPMSDEAFFQRLDEQDARHQVSVQGIQVRAFDYRRLLEEGAVDAALLSLDSLFIDIYLNKHLPKRPEPPPPLPHDLFQRIDRPVDIDTLRVPRARVTYSLLPENSQQRGVITFEKISGTIYNLTNDERQVSPSTPVLVKASGLVAGVAPLHTTIELTPHSAELSLAYPGGMGEMDLKALNSIFVPATSFQIESGMVDTLWFDVSVDHGVASGSLHAIYRNLDIRLVGQANSNQNIIEKLKTFVTNNFLINSQNVPSEEGPLRVGTIAHTYDGKSSFFAFLWHALRSGIYSIIGIGD